MNQIPLTQGKVAVVSRPEYKFLRSFKWRAHRDSKTGKYYAARTVREPNGKQRVVMMHRVIMGVSAGMEVDHRDGDGLNNRRSNLRVCSHQQNMAGQRRKGSAKSSRYKGVCWVSAGRKHWQVRCKNKFVGVFADEEEAAHAYDKAARQSFGRFAVLNFS